MKQALSNIGMFLLIVLLSPFFILLFIFYIVPAVFFTSIRENIANKKQAQREELEKLTFQKMCIGCPNEKYCHEEAVSCLDYEEAVDNGM